VVFAFLFGVVGALTFNVLLILLAWFIYGVATTESRTVVLDELLEGITVADVMRPGTEPLAADDSVATALNRTLEDRRTVLPVSEGSGIVGPVTMDTVRRVAAGERASAPVSEATVEAPPVKS